jgi:hypothetical protein
VAFVQSRWDVYNLMGARVVSPTFSGPSGHCWDTGKIVLCFYVIRLNLTYADGTKEIVTRKVLVVPRSLCGISHKSLKPLLFNGNTAVYQMVYRRILFT